MSPDFVLVLGGGVVSLVTTLVVLFITDLVYRRDHAHADKPAQTYTSPLPPSSPEDGKVGALSKEQRQ